jgi:hypothetical protein
LHHDTVSEVKRGDCTFYNCCLDQAEKENWPNFGCQNCTAYQAIDPTQREWDLYQLLMLQAAADNVMGQGNAGRKRGAKPGADAKLRVWIDAPSVENSEPPAEEHLEDAPLMSAYPAI